MNRAVYFLLVLLLMFPTAALAGSTQCSKYHLLMEGTTTPIPGYTYTEIVEMHKVGQSSGYDGKWQVDRFTQINTYPHLVQPSVFMFSIAEFGDGQWMLCETKSDGNVLTNDCAGGQYFLDVQANRIGVKKYGNWPGKITGKQAQFQFDPNNRNEPVITGEIRQPEKKKVTLDIVVPQEENFAFSGDSPGVLQMEFQAQVTPSQYEQDIQWTVPEIEGSEYIVDPPNARGPHIKVIYKGLPKDNSQFGPKNVQAVVNSGGCMTQDTKQVKIFYLRDAKNNPEGKYPNWFYYWKQTPAARPRGQMVNIEYGGTTFDLCTNPQVTAQYTSGYGHATIHVCDLSRLGSDFHNRFPLLSTSPPYHNGWATARYIDTFAVAVIHEYVHWLAYHNWREGKTVEQMNADDTDKDGIPDTAEQHYFFDPDKFQTHMADHPVLKDIGGDEEWLAYSSMSEISLGALDKYDWGRPGKNWQ